MLDMEESKLNTPAIIELFGHTKMAGVISEHVIGSTAFIRVEVPKTNNQEAFTRMLNPSAIYALNPCTPEVMLAMANSLNYAPITAWDLPESIKEKMRRGELAEGQKPKPREWPTEDDKFGDDEEHDDPRDRDEGPF